MIKVFPTSETQRCPQLKRDNSQCTLKTSRESALLQGTRRANTSRPQELPRE